MNPLRYQIAGAQGGGGFNPYAAGRKQYGLGGRAAATSGPVSTEGQRGYDQRDTEQRARRQAVLQRMQAAQNGNYMSSDYLKGSK